MVFLIFSLLTKGAFRIYILTEYAVHILISSLLISEKLLPVKYDTNCFLYIGNSSTHVIIATKSDLFLID